MPNINQPTRTLSTLATLRALVPNRRLTPSEVRQVTERQANHLRRLSHITENQFPIEAIELLPRIELRPEPDMPTSAMAFWDGGNWVILVNTAETLNRQRFSVLHELHHVICHTAKRQMFGTDYARNPDAERAADYFAACVLMPKLLVKRHWGRGPRTVSAMARRFSVSHQAMQYRLNQLGLVDPNPRCAWDQQTLVRHLRPQRQEIAA